MRIGIDAACWGNQRGYGRFTRGLLTALLAQPTEHEFVFLIDSPTAAHVRLPAAAQVRVVPTSSAHTAAAAADSNRSLADLRAMAVAVAQARLDLLFFPSVYSYFPVVTRAKLILGIHDVIAEDYPAIIFPDRRRRLLWQLKSALGRLQSRYILTVSNYARQGIIRTFRHPAERVFVIDEAPDPIFRPLAESELDQAVLARAGLAPGERFLIYLGGVNPHKNLPALIEALAALRSRPTERDLRLLIVGEVERDGFTPGYASLQARISSLGMAHAVQFTGFIADHELVHLLNAALVLVLPSLAEGFGLPAVEAAACGTPVVATRNSPLPELLADGGLFIDPTQPAELRAALAALLDNEPQRLAMGRAAQAAAARLSWDSSARQMQALLAHVEGQR